MEHESTLTNKEIPNLPTVTLPLVSSEQLDRIHKGQRRINFIWESTQSLIALVVVMANMLPPLIAAYTGHSLTSPPEAVTNTLFLVIGFYFARTNHSSIGGVGARHVGR